MKPLFSSNSIWNDTREFRVIYPACCWRKVEREEESDVAPRVTFVWTSEDKVWVFNARGRHCAGFTELAILGAILTRAHEAELTRDVLNHSVKSNSWQHGVFARENTIYVSLLDIKYAYPWARFWFDNNIMCTNIVHRKSSFCLLHSAFYYPVKRKNHNLMFSFIPISVISFH